MSNKDPMFDPDHRTDPHRLHGQGFIGPGGAHDRDGVLIDTRNAVALESVNVCAMETQAGNPAIAMVLGGRVVRTTDHVDVVFLMPPDGAAGIITELIALAGRMSGDDPTGMLHDILERMAKLRAEGNLT